MADDDSLNPTAALPTFLHPPAIEQYANPYFLHHSNNTSLVLVSDPLTDENYTSWSRSMIIALTVKNKVGFVDGSIARPTGDSLHSWIICNNIVIAWILNSLAKEISASVLFSNSAREIWLDLKERFQRQNRPRIFQLRRDLSNLMQDQLLVSAYFTRLKTLWTELSSYRPTCTCGRCTCGGVKEILAFQQQEHVMCFLMGLNESFSQLRGQLLLMEPEPSIFRVFSLVAQEAQQRAIIAPVFASPSALMVRNTSLPAGTTRSSSSPSFSSQSKRKDKAVCTHCGLIGHTVDRCYKLHGYPLGYRTSANRNNSSSHRNTSDSTKAMDSSNSSSLPHSLASLSADQCQGLLSLLQSHLTKVQPTTVADPGQSHVAGQVTFEDDWQS